MPIIERAIRRSPGAHRREPFGKSSQPKARAVMIANAVALATIAIASSCGFAANAWAG